MGQAARPKSIELKDELEVHRTEWRIHRIAWFLFAVLLLVTAFGLIGDGPFARRSVSTPDSTLAIEYDRLGRYESPAELRLDILPTGRPAGATRVLIGREFIESVRIEEIKPEPTAVRVAGGMYMLEFDQTGVARSIVTFLYAARRAGTIALVIEVPGHGRITTSQFIFP